MLITFSAHANFFTVVKALHFYPDRLNTFIAHQHHIGGVDRRFTLNNAPLPVLGRGTAVPFDDIGIFNQNALFLTIDIQYFTDFAIVFAGNDLDLIVFFDMAFKPMHDAVTPW
jgi:hypothetical protein